MPSAAAYPTLYFDVGSPYAYLTAERIESVLGPVRWVPVLLGGIFRATGRVSWASTERRDDGRGEVEARAVRYGLPPVRWPSTWPNDGLLAMWTATWAAQQGAAAEFARAALRVQFADGLPLSEPDHVATALQRAGLDADEGLRAATTAPVKDALRHATDAALARGVFGVPSIEVGPFLLWGDDRLDDACTILRRPAA